MVFLCFSSKDRYTIAESILYHLKNYGIKTWYDYHMLMLGDDKITENITNGVKKSNYVILILSPNFYDCECGNMELNAIKLLYEAKRVHIFPILYNVKADELPNEYLWITELIYNELSDETPTLPTCNQIVCQILKDAIRLNNYKNLNELTSSSDFINKIIYTYYYINNDNFNAKLSLLYGIFIFLETSCKEMKNCPYTKILEQLFKSTALSLKISFKEIIIAEYVIAILLYESGMIE